MAEHDHDPLEIARTKWWREAVDLLFPPGDSICYFDTSTGAYRRGIVIKAVDRLGLVKVVVQDIETKAQTESLVPHCFGFEPPLTDLRESLRQPTATSAQPQLVSPPDNTKVFALLSALWRASVKIRGRTNYSRTDYVAWQNCLDEVEELLLEHHPPLAWERRYDDNDCSYWEAASSWTVDESTPLYFRIIPRLFGDKIVYVPAHDSELMCTLNDNQQWDTVQEAKAAVEGQHRWDTVQEAKAAVEGQHRQAVLPVYVREPLETAKTKWWLEATNLLFSPGDSICYFDNSTGGYRRGIVVKVIDRCNLVKVVVQGIETKAQTEALVPHCFGFEAPLSGWRESCDGEAKDEV